VHFAVTLVAGGVTLALVARGRTSSAVAVLVVVTALVVAVALHDPPSRDDARGPTQSQLREPPLHEVAAAGLRGGLLTFGGAYTALSFVERDAVTDGRWMTRSQFVDGLAVSSAVPAPFIIFATFDGYVGGGGLVAALLMTAMIFLPAFSFTLIGHRHLERLVAEPRLHALLDGVAAAVVGLLGVIAVGLTLDALDSVFAAAVLVATLVVLHVWRSRLAIVGVVVAAGVAGVVAQFVVA
jgi:chromate transporter